MCDQNVDCCGITFEGTGKKPRHTVQMSIKSKCSPNGDANWNNYIKQGKGVLGPALAAFTADSKYGLMSGAARRPSPKADDGMSGPHPAVAQRWTDLNGASSDCTFQYQIDPWSMAKDLNGDITAQSYDDCKANCCKAASCLVYQWSDDPRTPPNCWFGDSDRYVDSGGVLWDGQTDKSSAFSTLTLTPTFFPRATSYTVYVPGAGTSTHEVFINATAAPGCLVLSLVYGSLAYGGRNGSVLTFS